MQEYIVIHYSSARRASQPPKHNHKSLNIRAYRHSAHIKHGSRQTTKGPRRGKFVQTFTDDDCVYPNVFKDSDSNLFTLDVHVPGGMCLSPRKSLHLLNHIVAKSIELDFYGFLVIHGIGSRTKKKESWLNFLYKRFGKSNVRMWKNNKAVSIVYVRELRKKNIPT